MTSPESHGLRMTNRKAVPRPLSAVPRPNPSCSMHRSGLLPADCWKSSTVIHPCHTNYGRILSLTNTCPHVLSLREETSQLSCDLSFLSLFSRSIVLYISINVKLFCYIFSMYTIFASVKKRLSRKPRKAACRLATLRILCV